MYAVGLIGSGTVGLLSVSEPGEIFFFLSWLNRNNCERWIGSTWGQDFEMLQGQVGKTASVLFWRKGFVGLQGCWQLWQTYKVLWWCAASPTLIILDQIGPDDGISLQLFHHLLLCMINKNSIVFLFNFISTVPVANKDADTNLADKRWRQKQIWKSQTFPVSCIHWRSQVGFPEGKKLSVCLVKVTLYVETHKYRRLF